MKSIKTISKKRMPKMMALTIVLTLFLLIFGIVTTRILRQLEDQYTSLTLKSRITEYQIKMERQITTNLEILSSVSPFFSSGDAYENPELLKQFCESNNNNIFVRMAYANKNGTVVRVYKGEEDYEITRIGQVEPKVKAIINQAFLGKTSISDVFVERTTQEKSIAFAIPVYNDGDIVGVLSGSYPVDVFSELLYSSELAQNQMENVDLIKSDGTFVVMSPQSVVKGTKDNLFDYGTYTNEDQRSIINQMKQKESFQAYYTYADNKYSSEFIPVNNTDFYLIYSDANNSMFKDFSFSVHYIQIIICIIIAIVMVCFVYMIKKILDGQKQLEEVAYYDQLTQLYNMYMFKDCVNKEEKTGFLATLDIRGFRYINNEFGEQKANLVLKEVAEVLKEQLDIKEYCARESTDIFWVSFYETDILNVEKRLLSLCQVIEKRCLEIINGYKVQIHVGVSRVDGCRIEAFERARFALRKAKKEMKNIIVWNDEQQKNYDLQFYIESHKETALQNREFKPYLQPKINYQNDECDSAELLVRWIRPDGQMIFPDQFISLFEQNGFCVNLDLYMFEQACQIIRQWIDEGKKVFHLSVNQSKLLFYKENYAEMLLNIVEKYDIDCSYITLEILENLTVDNVELMNKTVAKLKSYGFSVSIDDFGSGYSSLNFFGSLSVDEIKLDRQFLKEIDNNENNKVIISGLIATLKNMDINIVVEGVETKENEAFIKMIDADYGQGYYYSRPIPLNEFEKKYNQ